MIAASSQRRIRSGESAPASARPPSSSPPVSLLDVCVASRPEAVAVLGEGGGEEGLPPPAVDAGAALVLPHSLLTSAPPRGCRDRPPAPSGGRFPGVRWRSPPSVRRRAAGPSGIPPVARRELPLSGLQAPDTAETHARDSRPDVRLFAARWRPGSAPHGDRLR